MRPPSTETRQSESASQAAKAGENIPAVGLRVIGHRNSPYSELLRYKGDNTVQDEDERPWWLHICYGMLVIMFMVNFNNIRK